MARFLVNSPSFQEVRCSINTPKRIGVYAQLLRRLPIYGKTGEAQPATKLGPGPSSGGRAGLDGCNIPPLALKIRLDQDRDQLL